MSTNPPPADVVTHEIQNVDVGSFGNWVSNVRLIVEEKAMLEAKAKEKGFKGLSDFIRAAAPAS